MSHIKKMIVEKKWFVDKLAQRGRSQRALARYMQLDASAVTHILNNRRKMQLDEAEQIARFIGEPVDEVLKHSGVTLKKKATAPLVGSADSVGIVTLITDQKLYTEAPPAQGLSAVQVRSVTGFDGALVFFSADESYPPDMVVGKPALITTKERLMLGILRRSLRESLYDIVYLDHTTEDQHVVSASPIHWIKP